ncbi:MAG: thioredoxin family protein [Bernardetiaceae bacterium]
MKTIKILGTGCAKCKLTETNVRKALAESGIAAEVIKVEDIQDIMAYNILTTPAVVIDETVIFKGLVPTPAQIIASLNN